MAYMGTEGAVIQDLDLIQTGHLHSHNRWLVPETATPYRTCNCPTWTGALRQFQC